MKCFIQACSDCNGWLAYIVRAQQRLRQEKCPCYLTSACMCRGVSFSDITNRGKQLTLTAGTERRSRRPSKRKTDDDFGENAGRAAARCACCVDGCKAPAPVGAVPLDCCSMPSQRTYPMK